MVRYLWVMLLVALGVAACETRSAVPQPIDVVSLQYDPYNYSMAELVTNAEAACEAMGGTRAIPVNNELNTDSVRWAYMNFECY